MEKDIIGIFLGKNKIIAASVNKRKEYRQIGFQGEVEYSYQNTTDIDECIGCLESTYNVDTLSELDVNLYVVDCGADLLLKNYLLRKLEDCRRVSSVFVTDLLYAVTGKKKQINPGCKIRLDFCDNNTYVCDESYIWINSDNDSSDIIICIKDIMMSFLFDVRDFQFDDSEMKNKLLEASQKWEEEKNELISKLKQSLLINQKTHIEELKRQKEKEIIADKRKLLLIEYEKCDGELRIIKDTSSNVFANENIAWIIQVNNKEMIDIPKWFTENKYENKQEKKIKLQAGYDGKICWLVPNNEIIKKHITNYYELCGHMIPIAVIGDPSDKVEDMIDWGRIQSKLKFK